MRPNVIGSLKHGLIVSCQITGRAGLPDPENPLKGSTLMAILAQAAVQGGAAGIRADGGEDIRAIRKVVEVPIVGIKKMDIPGFEVRITPTLEAAREVVESGADIVALDVTKRPHPNGLSGLELMRKVKKELGIPIMADISVLEEGIAAAEAGADLVGTTLAGYTPYTRSTDGPDLELVAQLSEKIEVPVIAEGRISSPEQARLALEAGAYAVCVGAMIINPKRIVEAYVREMSLWEGTSMRREAL